MNKSPLPNYAAVVALILACASFQRHALARDEPAQGAAKPTQGTVTGPPLQFPDNQRIPVVRQRTVGVGQCHEEYRDVIILPIVAVLAADDDGSKAMGEMIGGKLVPKAPWLHAPAGGPSLLSNGNADYILEWVRQTNGVLERSDATFRLGEDIAYVSEKSSLINAGRDGDSKAMNAFFTSRRAASGNNPYSHRMILLFAWGADSAKPFGGGASDIRSNFVAMPGLVNGGTRVQGKDVPGWNMMAHEMGHHLGLQHTFAGLEEMLDNLAVGYKISCITVDKDGRKQPVYSGSSSPMGYSPWTPTKVELERVEEIIRDYPYALDNDSFPITDKNSQTPYADGVSDTGIDLGIGLAAMKGVLPCDTLSNASIAQLEGLDNSVNRLNPMSYSVCPVADFRYSPGQVKVMEASLQRPDRAVFVTHRTQSTRVCEPPEWKAGPGHVKPGEPVMRMSEPLVRRLPALVERAHPRD